MEPPHQAVARIVGIRPESLVPALALLMEGLWVYSWMLFFSHWDFLDWQYPPIGLGSTSLILGVGYLATRRSPREGKRRALVQGALLLASIAIVALMVRIEQGGGHALFSTEWWSYAQENAAIIIFGSLYGAYLLWRSFSLGYSEISFDQLYRLFVMGFIAMAALLIIWGMAAKSDGVPPIDSWLVGYMAAFFVAGLAGLALTNLRSIQREARRLGHGAQAPSSQFVGFAVGFTLLFVLVAFGIASVVSLNFLTYFRDPVATVAGWLLTGFLYGIILPISFIIAGIAYPFVVLLRWLRQDPEITRFDAPGLGNLREIADEESAAGIPAWVITAGKWGLLALVVIIVVFFLLRAYRRRGGQEQDGGEQEVSESLWSWRRVSSDLFNWLRGLLWFLRKSGEAQDMMTRPAAARDGDDTRLLDVRALYRGLLWEGKAAGSGKRDRETPFEYADRLSAALPETKTDVLGITNEYVQARYGHQPVPKERAVALNSIWRRLRRLLRGELPESGA
ncbi:MAG: DUF4129 domain-containing protein [Chloroflexi bacterium]|nr:DUF4129 domain-containing protein [Chloroflexota bacterium]